MRSSELPVQITDSMQKATTHRTSYLLLTFSFVTLTLSFLSSCNTTRGLGRDVQTVGNTIERQAVKVQKKL